MKRKIISLLLTVIMIFSCSAISQVAFAATMRGDLNGDGKVDLKDYLVLRKSIAGIDMGADEKQLDCNGDDTIDVNDAIAMAKYLVNLGQLHFDVQEGWNNLINWEGLDEGITTSSAARIIAASGATFETKSIENYPIKNTKSDSKMAMALVSSGLVQQNKYNGTNPTIGQNPSSIGLVASDREKLANATNLRVTLNMINSNSEIDIIYIGCMIGSKKYYHKITKENYSDFNYFYFVGKEFTEFKFNTRRTYLEDDNPNKIILSKDDVKNIRTLYFWLEADTANGKPLIIDDIDYYEGANGYDSTVEDENLPQPDEPENDGTTKYISISFDDGPNVYSDSATKKHYMDYYFDLADEFDATFTFFLIGNNLDDGDIPTLKQAVEKGHELQNHTKGHASVKNESSRDNYINNQIKPVDDWLNENVGKPLGKDLTTTLLRPPYLDTNSNLYAFLKYGNNNLGTNIQACIGGYCPNDYNLTSVDYKVEYYKRHLKDGAIVLAHEHYIDNVETFRIVMNYFKKYGYKFVNITEMFKAKGITPQLTKSSGNGILYNDITE